MTTFFDTPRYLETLEFKVSEQERLQNRINDLEARLRELDPSMKHHSMSGSAHQFLTPPETSTLVSQQNYVSPMQDSIHSQSQSPQMSSYPDDRLSDARTKSSVIGTTGTYQDGNTDPGVFEADDAGKGWYLGCSSGSIPSPSGMLTSSDLHEFHQEHSLIRYTLSVYILCKYSE
jgi:hypothetical protein